MTSKEQLLQQLGDYGPVKQLPRSRSLFEIGGLGTRLYFRYSRIHERGSAFFGLRKEDLRRLEGRESFICFVLGDSLDPVVLPFSDFEELFAQMRPASDGQYKVQIYSGSDKSLQLYIPRKGRFNIEGYRGVDGLTRSLEVRPADLSCELTHAKVQSFLAGIGTIKGYNVFVPARDRELLDRDITANTKFRHRVPHGFESAEHILSEIDVLWLPQGGDAVAALFEVEHSTTIYSGLLRFNDVLLLDRRLTRFNIVADECRRSLFSRQVFRPTFQTSGLTELTSFLEYSDVFHWHRRLSHRGESHASARSR